MKKKTPIKTRKAIVKNQSEQVYVETTSIEGIRKRAGYEDFDVVAKGLDKGFGKFESIARSFESNVLKKGLSIKSADLELGISFTAGGAIIIKGEIGASLLVRIHFEIKELGN